MHLLLIVVRMDGVMWTQTNGMHLRQNVRCNVTVNMTAFGENSAKFQPYAVV